MFFAGFEILKENAGPSEDTRMVRIKKGNLRKKKDLYFFIQKKKKIARVSCIYEANSWE